MKLTEQEEEILETLWVEIEEKKKYPEMTLLRDNAAFLELLDKKLIVLKKNSVNLTGEGHEAAKLCIRRHRLAERLLVDVLNVKSGLVHETSCKVEHALQKGIEDNICILLGHPKTCPHGQKIPQGNCCKKKKTNSQSIVVPLSELKTGQSGKIAYLQTDDTEELRKIMAMGALPGLKIKINQRFPSYVFQIGQSQFAIDKQIAKLIHVWTMV